MPVILFLLLLILAAVGVGIYASENTGTHSLTFLQWQWSAVADWVPVVVAALVIGGLFLLYMIYSGLVHGVRIGSMRRRVSTRENAINDMRAENQRLREENARLRAEQRGMDRGVAAADRGGVNPNLERAPVANNGPVRREPVAAGSDTTRTAPPYQPRQTFGERVRAFFRGGEPARY